MSSTGTTKEKGICIFTLVAAYLTSGFPSIRANWYLKHKKWVHIVTRDAYRYLEFRFWIKTEDYSEPNNRKPPLCQGGFFMP